MVDWGYFDKFDEVSNKYLPAMGEGETKATQVVTAVSKLVYKYYNDGDVYDNTGYLDGWLNDLSSYANWLDKYAGVKYLHDIWACSSDGEYEDILKRLADDMLDMKKLAELDKEPKVGSIYKCDGDFRFVEYDDDDYEDDDWEDD